MSCLPRAQATRPQPQPPYRFPPIGTRQPGQCISRGASPPPPIPLMAAQTGGEHAAADLLGAAVDSLQTTATRVIARNRCSFMNRLGEWQMLEICTTVRFRTRLGPECAKSVPRGGDQRACERHRAHRRRCYLSWARNANRSATSWAVMSRTRRSGINDFCWRTSNSISLRATVCR